MNINDTNIYYTVKEVCNLLKCSEPYIAKKRKLGEIVAIKIGTKVLIPKSSIDNLLVINTEGGKIGN